MNKEHKLKINDEWFIFTIQKDVNYKIWKFEFYRAAECGYSTGETKIQPIDLTVCCEPVDNVNGATVVAELQIQWRGCWIESIWITEGELDLDAAVNLIKAISDVVNNKDEYGVKNDK